MSAVRRDGDWECASCGNNNFAFRTECKRCGVPRDGGTSTYTAPSGGGGGGRKESRPGDWICQQCGNDNFSYRETCHRCAAPRQQGQVEDPRQMLQQQQLMMAQQQQQQQQQMMMAQQQQQMMGYGNGMMGYGNQVPSTMPGAGSKRPRHDSGGYGGAPQVAITHKLPFPAVRIRGLPFETTEDDVLQFFADIALVDVLLEMTGDGRCSGTGFVVLGTDEALQAALLKNKESLGRRYVEVFTTTKAEYYKAASAAALAM